MAHKLRKGQSFNHFCESDGIGDMAKIFNFMRGLSGKKTSLLSGDAALFRLLEGISRRAIFIFSYGFRSGPGHAAVLCSSMNGTPLGLIAKYGKVS